MPVAHSTAQKRLIAGFCDMTVDAKLRRACQPADIRAGNPVKKLTRNGPEASHGF
jgi:hypothetical protein